MVQVVTFLRAVNPALVGCVIGSGFAALPPSAHEAAVEGCAHAIVFFLLGSVLFCAEQRPWLHRTRELLTLFLFATGVFAALGGGCALEPGGCWVAGATAAVAAFVVHQVCHRLGANRREDGARGDEPARATDPPRHGE